MQGPSLSPRYRVSSVYERWGDVTVPERSRAPSFASVLLSPPGGQGDVRWRTQACQSASRTAVQPRLTHEAGRCDVEVARPQRGRRGRCGHSR